MQWIRPKSRALFALVACAAMTLLCMDTPLAAQTTRPALSQLAEDVHALYRLAEAGTVRVRIPVPVLADLNELHKWEQHLDADLRRRLRESRLQGPVRIRIDRSATGPAATQPATTRAIDPAHRDRFDVLAQDFPDNEQVGLVLDDKGHVLVHYYIDRRHLGDRPLRVTAGATTVEATLIGADRQTRMSVLRLAEPLGKPLPASAEEPQPGSLVMLLGGHPGADLVLWTGRNPDHGLVIGIDGTVTGFAHGGQLLKDSAFRPIAEQILQHGHVKRAKLGALIDTVAVDDPIRREVSSLGNRPALRIVRVLSDSAAEAAGLRDNDIILSLAGEPVTDIFAFAATIARCRGNSELKVLRSNEELTITVALRPE